MAYYLGFEPTKSEVYFFVSYKRADRERVAPIASELNRNGIPLWYDEDISYGSEWEGVLADRIEKSSGLLLFVTRNTFVKPEDGINYVQLEYKVAKRNGKQIIPVFLDSLDGADIPAEYKFWFEELAAIQGVNGAGKDESELSPQIFRKLSPIYDQVRAEKTGEPVENAGKKPKHYRKVVNGNKVKSAFRKVLIFIAVLAVSLAVIIVILVAAVSSDNKKRTDAGSAAESSAVLETTAVAAADPDSTQGADTAETDHEEIINAAAPSANEDTSQNDSAETASSEAGNHENGSDVIDWHDPQVWAAVSDQLTNIDKNSITYDDVKVFTQLDLTGYNVSDISDLAYFINLSYLDLSVLDSNGLYENVAPRKLDDLSPLKSLHKLQTLYLTNRDINDSDFGQLVAMADDLPDLNVLGLNGNNITDITGISQFHSLSMLYLANNHITNGNNRTNADELSYMDGLVELNLAYNRISDLDFLSNLKNLYLLNICGIKFRSALPLMDLPNIVYFYADNCNIRDFGVMYKMEGLQVLSLMNYNSTVTISNIKDLARFRNLNWLALAGNSVSDLSPLTSLEGLTYLDLRDNQVTDLTPLGSLTNLQSLYLAGNSIEDYSPLNGLSNLQYYDF